MSATYLSSNSALIFPSAFLSTQPMQPTVSSAPAYCTASSISLPSNMPATASSPNGSVCPTTVPVQPAVQSLQWHSWISPNLYELVPLLSRTKKCYGCGGIFSAKFCSPPHNLVVRHFDRQVVRRNEQTGQIVYSSDFCNSMDLCCWIISLPSFWMPRDCITRPNQIPGMAFVLAKHFMPLEILILRAQDGGHIVRCCPQTVWYVIN